MNQSRVIISSVSPILTGENHQLKRIIDDFVDVNVTAFADGHDHVQLALVYKHQNDRTWKEVRLQPGTEQDEWTGQFQVSKIGTFKYNIQGWVDWPLNWLYGTRKKIEAKQDVTSELLEGLEYVKVAGKDAQKAFQKLIRDCHKFFKQAEYYDFALDLVFSSQLERLFIKYPTKEHMSTLEKDVDILVEREKARFSTWYEFFPRSAAKEGHGTFKDAIQLLPKVAEMGFDVLYLPPIHPIGEVNRKGKNNTVVALDGDVGSTWGIGSQHGGHKSIHPALGTLEDFQDFIEAAKKLDIEIAMDLAFQAAPDHPYVKEHPNWFKWRPDGSVQYAENPPKKYQDILPFYFETKEWKQLWKELLSVGMFWTNLGINVFRVDNPHTKPFHFWGWFMSEMKKKNPNVIFLSEAFARPNVMFELAKQGFSQSYTYFTWRETKAELESYIKELTQTEVKEFYRPNFWPNTPDINPFHLQNKNETQHIVRYALAALLSSNTGIYGPVFEQMHSEPLPGKEEYLDSEKFQTQSWDWEKKNTITEAITKINYIRKSESALQQTNNIEFCNINNDSLIAFHKWNQAEDNHVLIVINLDPDNTQSEWLELPNQFKGKELEMFDLFTGNKYTWNQDWNYVELSPSQPLHIFKIND